MDNYLGGGQCNGLLCDIVVNPYWGMPCGQDGKGNCNSVWLANDIKAKTIKCSSCCVLANPGYGTIRLNVQNALEKRFI